uniref:Conorfamide-Vc1 n=1 Tax=Conus victoriae TaxID=319920 RepID=CRFA_CONVC|nr:RecName: Full=Conorfamide-Vc1; Short=CNF-Vc1; AltName: Full=Cono-RFamide-Vc1; Flags: Precursor [Conus victoriae]
MSGRGFLLLALLLLVTVEATKVEKKHSGFLLAWSGPRNRFVRFGRRDMQSPLLSERLRL